MSEQPGDDGGGAGGSSGESRPVPAFIISLIAGLWMLASGGMMSFGFSMREGMMGDASSWMWRHNMMDGMGTAYMWSIVGFVAGIVTIISAAAMYNAPRSTATWGVVILTVSFVDMFAGSGGYLAGALGVIGGIMAILWKP